MKPCAFPPCPHRFHPERPHHRFCTPQCRKQDHIRRSVAAARRTRSIRVRRPSRDGLGTKLYVTPAQLRELRLGPPYPVALQRKLQGASDRLPSA